MKHILYVMALLLFLSCENQEKKARIELQKAQSMYDRKEYAGAKRTLDSLKINYPKEFPVLRERQALIKKIELAEQTRNLLHCDSLLQCKWVELDENKKNFIFEKDTAYEDIGKYIHKTQQIEANLQKSYIRSGVNELGEMFITSIYYSSRPNKHTALKVSAKGGEYAQTESIPHDGGNNYTFTDEGMHTEAVTYTKDKDNGAILFIYDRVKEPITATYIGDKEITITMSNADKVAVVETYNLSITLSDIEKLKKEINIAQAKIDYLNERAMSE